MNIPRVLHQTWKDSTIPASLAGFQASWRRHNPTYDYRLWTDESARAFVAAEYSDFLDVYDGYDHFIKRVDAVRYLWLHRLGGVYADLDFECLRPIDELLAGRQVVLGREPPEHGFLHVEGAGYRPHVCNAFMASVPGHPFWELVIRRLFDARRATDPLEATGPRFLTRVLEEHRRVDGSVFLADWPVLYAATLRGGVPKHMPAEAVAVHHWRGSWWRA
jgi:mannosyltransferase OCH1-like enzyme